MARYTINDVEYPSVTEILDLLDKPGLRQWSANCAADYINENYKKDISQDEFNNMLTEAKQAYRNISKEAMNTGSIIHGLIEEYIKICIVNGRPKEYKIDNENEEIKNAFNAFLDWEKENIIEWIESEKNIVDSVCGYAGTLDAVAKMKNNKIYVIDFKASKSFYDTYNLQISAYRQAYCFNCSPINTPQGMGVLRLDKETGLPEWKDYSKVFENKITAFTKLVDFYYLYKKRRLKNNKRVQ